MSESGMSEGIFRGWKCPRQRKCMGKFTCTHTQTHTHRQTAKN